jgi:hypothetical protein
VELRVLLGTSISMKATASSHATTRSTRRTTGPFDAVFRPYSLAVCAGCRLDASVRSKFALPLSWGTDRMGIKRIDGDWILLDPRRSGENLSEAPTDDT